MGDRYRTQCTELFVFIGPLGYGLLRRGQNIGHSGGFLAFS
jgi:hypothetical protein